MNVGLGATLIHLGEALILLPRGSTQMYPKRVLSCTIAAIMKEHSRKTNIENEDDLASRLSYINDIRGIQPQDHQEQDDVNITLEWLRSSQYLHKPMSMDCHLGVLFVLLSPNLKSTFLINHRKAQLWLPPGGHVDSGLTLQQAVELEIREEMNIEPKFLSTKPFFLTRTLTGGVNAGHIDVTSWFLLEGNPEINYEIQAKEASEGRWTDLEVIENDPNFSHLYRAIKKIKARY